MYLYTIHIFINPSINSTIHLSNNLFNNHPSIVLYIHLLSSYVSIHYLKVIINEDWQDMFVLLRSDKHNSEQGFYSVYRNQQEGVIPQEQRKLTANIEADHQHIANVVNFACCYLWTRIIIDTPTIGYNGK